jgi:hypothetical protein
MGQKDDGGFFSWLEHGTSTELRFWMIGICGGSFWRSYILTPVVTTSCFCLPPP